MIFLSPTQKEGNIQVPNIISTIKPSTEVGVSANVADLVVAEVADDGVLPFSWNSRVASGALLGGVEIAMPADQLRSVVASHQNGPLFFAGVHVPILEGFTSIDTLEVSSPGRLRVWASLTDVQNDLPVNIDARGDVELKSADLKSLAVHRGNVVADVDGSVANLDITGAGPLVYLTAPGGIKNGSVIAVDGVVSYLEANSTVLGKMTANTSGNGLAEVSLPSCVNVSTSGNATCTEEAPWGGWGKEVDTSRQAATREGTTRAHLQLTVTATLMTALAVG